MVSERDRAIQDAIGCEEDLIVDELCNFQFQLDQGEADSGDSIQSNEIPAGLRDTLNDCRNFLEFLNDAPCQTTIPNQAPSNRSFSGYALPTRISRFKIIEQLGYGGFGVVFRGLDPIIGREVAIKIPRPEFLEAPEFIERFAREASIVAQLTHPNIVSIYESGCYEIVPYIVMPYLRGKTLPEWRAEESEVQPRTVATIVRELAVAVAHAHERGILHRDLKPGNVILIRRPSKSPDADSTFIPMLTDFGMARCTEVGSSHTRTGTMVGTSCYMSPEQAEGRTHDITARSDVYGLGTVLYELLTGKPPFQTTSDVQTLRKVLQDDPRSPRSIRPQIPIDLEMICLKCLEKSPSNRYSSAEALADDLQRFLDGAPIRARKISRVARIKKWIRRYPTSAAVIAAGVFGVLTLIGLSVWYNSRLIALLEIAEAERLSSRRNERQANRRAYDSDMRNAKISLDRGNLRQTLKFLERQKPIGAEFDFRDFSWWALWREYTDSSRLMGTHDGHVTAVAVTRSGDLVASSGSDSVIRLWSMPTRKMIAELHGHETGGVESINFSPNGQRLASAGKDGTVRVWDLKTLKEVFVRREHRLEVSDVVYSPRGDVLASAGADSTIRLWDPTTGTAIGILRGHLAQVYCLAFHPYEDTLASGSADGTIRLWDLCDRCPDSRLPGGSIRVCATNHWPRAVAFEPTGKNLIVGTNSAETYEFNFDEERFGQELSRFSERGNALCIVWPRNSAPIVALGNSEIRVANRFDPGYPGEFRYGHQKAVLSIAVPADGSFLVSGSQDGQIRYWPQFQGQTRIAISMDDASACEEDPRLYSVQWREDFLTADLHQDRLSIYRMPERQLQRTIPKGDNDDFTLSPTGRLLLVYQRDGLATCYRVESGAMIWSKQFPSAKNRARSDSCAIDRSEQYALVAAEKELLVVSATNSEILRRLAHPSTVGRVVFFERPGTSLAAISTCGDGLLRVWDVESGAILSEHRSNSRNVSSIAVSKDQRLVAIAIGGDSPMVNVWRLQDMELVAVVPITSQRGSGSLGFDINKVAFLTPSKIVVRSNSGIGIWDIQDEAELMAFPEFERAGAFAISPDGQQLAIPQRGRIRIVDGTPQPNFPTNERR